jgi:hypothetical protein
MGNRCTNCVHYIRQEESWEMPHIFWYECKVVPSAANLKSFPYKNTKCKKFERKTNKVGYI